MKSVVMIAYNFPPEGNAGAHRPLRFVRHLPLLGWQPTVVTLETNFYERYDPGLISLVPKGIEIIRVPNRDPWQAFQSSRARRTQEKISNSSAETAARIRSAQSHPIRSFIRESVHSVERWCYHPDLAMLWIRPAVKAIVDLSITAKPKAIWASGPPWSSFVAAGLASRRSGVPYVLDFRDSWSMVYTQFERKRPAWAKNLDRRILRMLLREARAVILRSETEAECFSCAYRGALEASKIHIIPNGFEGDVQRWAPLNGDKCRVLYTGTLSDYRYDTLLQALQVLRKSESDLPKRLHFQFVGEGAEALGEEASVIGLGDMFSVSRSTSQDEVERLSREAHALLILERPATMKGHELLAGAKLFGYLKAGRPIVGLLPPCEAKKILERIGASTVADVDSVLDIVAVLQKVIDAWSNGNLPDLLPDSAACEVYSAQRQTEALTRALEGRLPSQVFVPGAIKIPHSLSNDIGPEGWLRFA